MRHLTQVLLVCTMAITAQAEEWQQLVGPDAAPDEIAPISAPFAMPQLQRPTFPDAVFPITDFGAQPGGEVKNTKAINGAIAACANAGGGKVVCPAGTWLTGAIHLKSNVELHLEKECVLRFSDDPNDYLPIVFTRWAGFECCNYSPLIYAKDCTNIAITGPGSLDGNGPKWWPWVDREKDLVDYMYREQVLKGVPPEKRVHGAPEAGFRPQFINPVNCSNVLLEGFTVAAPGPFWTVDITYCDRVIVRKLRVMSVGGPNNDGINIDSSTNVLVEHCYLNTQDDCLCMKSGMNEDAWRVGRPTENVVVRYIRTAAGHGGAVFGSDMSGDIRDVYVHSCIYDGTDVGIRIKSTRGRGGVIENLWFENIEMNNIARQAIEITTAYRAFMATTEGKAPIFRDISFKNINAKGAGQGLMAQGLPEAPIERLRFENVSINAREPMSVEYISDIDTERLNITAQTQPEKK